MLTHTFPVVKAEVNSIVDDHKGSFGVTLGIIAGLPVAHQGNHVLSEEILHFRYRRGFLQDLKSKSYGSHRWAENRFLHGIAILAQILKGTDRQMTKVSTKMRTSENSYRHGEFV